MATATKIAVTPKAKKPAVAPATRIVELMKRNTLSNKLTAAELDSIAQLAASLKVFVSV